MTLHNKQFQNVLETIQNKNKKKESIATELEWIQSQLLSEDAKICESAANVLFSSCKIGIDYGLVLNTILFALSRIGKDGYELLSDALFRILLLDLDKPNYVCPFGILTKAHPLLILIDDSSEKMLHLSQKIVGVLKNNNR